VGDLSAIRLFSLGLYPQLSIIDGKILRKSIREDLLRVIKYKLALSTINPAGSITYEAWQTVKEAFCYSVPLKINVQGEEDLLALPAIYFAPLRSLIVYGFKGKNCVIEVNEEIKKWVYDFIGWKKYEEVLVGGSWDRLHAGHKFILLTAFEMGERVEIGITSPDFFQEKVKSGGWSYNRRLSELKSFLKKFDLLKSATFTEIRDFVGPALERGDALVITSKTLISARQINLMRERKGKKALKLIRVKLIRARDGKPISSERIRKGEIDRDGFIL
jgi:pantetheine-phosphate adenylyltransferase